METKTITIQKIIDTLPVKDNITSFVELSKLVDHMSGLKWCYRGVRKNKYKLLPKISRNGIMKDQDGKKIPFDQGRENTYIDEFKRRVVQHKNIPSYEHDLEWLALAQHHGLPTRLLDWTESIFVAAFFATEHGGIENEKKVNAAIYGMPEKDHPNVVIYHSNHTSPRISAQSGLFTYHQMDPDKNFEPEHLLKWTIDSDVCFSIKKSLSKVGINYATMFPDLDGLSKQLTWKMKWGL